MLSIAVIRFSFIRRAWDLRWAPDARQAWGTAGLVWLLAFVLIYIGILFLRKAAGLEVSDPIPEHLRFWLLTNPFSNILWFALSFGNYEIALRQLRGDPVDGRSIWLGLRHWRLFVPIAVLSSVAYSLF